MEKLGRLVNLAKREKGGVGHALAMRSLHVTARELREVIKEAVEKEYIKVFVLGTATKAKRFYTWTGKELKDEDKEFENWILKAGEIVDITDEYRSKK